jgi:hypothetical protein
MNVHGIAALAIIHKICAALFVLLVLVSVAIKAFSNKKA